ncbi:MAG: hypothetical protein ACON4G_01965 [Candidatus Puniceispirillaceae bacterium]
MTDQTTCAIISQSEATSAAKERFICANDQLHHGLLNEPLAIFIYAAAVLFIMFLVKRNGDRPIRQSPQSASGKKQP